jgi:hypothetical protein
VKNTKTKSTKTPAAITAETPATASKVRASAVNLAASTLRVFSRIAPALAKILAKKDAAKAAAEQSKAEIETLLTSAKADWKVVASEHKDKAERKTLAVKLHKALQEAPFGLTSPRASEALDLIGLGGLIRAKHTKDRVILPEGTAETVFAFVDKLLGEDGEKVKTALSRAYGKAREVYRKG